MERGFGKPAPMRAIGPNPASTLRTVGRKIRSSQQFLPHRYWPTRSFVFASLALIPLLGLYYLIFTPDVLLLKECLTTTMYQVKLCPNDLQNYVRLRNISPTFRTVVVQTEDAQFFNHKGFDFQEIQKSIETNIERKNLARGGSTISQQLAKNVFLTKEKSFWRKLREALLVMRIEHNFSKNEILEKYLNVIEFGPGIYGIAKASQFYFKKTPARLDLFESIFLAHLLPNPKAVAKRFSQGNLSRYSKRRMRTIATNLLQYHVITEAEYQNFLASYSARVEPLAPAVSSPPELQDEASTSDSNDDDAEVKRQEQIFEDMPEEYQHDLEEQLDEEELQERKEQGLKSENESPSA